MTVIWNAANILTSMRLVLVPVFLYLLWTGHYVAAFTVFIAAAVTDMVDGTVARVFCKPTKFGAVLDPISDKLLVESAFISLWLLGVLPFWFVILALFRDVMIIFGLIYLEVKEVKFEVRATLVSKVATLMQSVVACFAIMLVGNIGTSWPWQWLWPAGLAITTALIFWSAIVYVVLGLKLVSKSQPATN